MRLIGRTTALVAAVILGLLGFSGAHASAVPAGDFPDGLNFGGLQRHYLVHVPPGLEQRIFDPFFTTKEVGRGTGQGLSIAHNAIKAHGGRLEFDTEIGKGTTFRVYLPIESAEREATAA